MIIAKPVIPNQFWILKDGERKVGNIEIAPGGFAVKIGDNVQSYKTINTIKQKVKIEKLNICFFFCCVVTRHERWSEKKQLS